VLASSVESNLVLGEDITIVKASEMAEKTLVRKAYGRHFSLKTLQSWVVVSWVSSYSSLPQISCLSKGWFMIKSVEVSQANKALLSGWCIDSSSVLLKKWDPSFDASFEKMDSIPIWVHFHGLPLHFWSVKCFQEIGNLLGDCISVDMSFE
jgi:hypothetical protein